METWFRNLLLTSATSCIVLFAAGVQATEKESVLIQPQIDRIEFNEAVIDSNDFEISLLAGYLSIEDFGVSPVLSARLDYFVNEKIFVQFSLGRARAGETSYETITGGAPILQDDERTLQYYSIDVGYNLFPGEAFFSPQTTFNSAFHVSGGIGNTRFAGSDRFTINFGAGYRLLLNENFSLSMDFRNLVFDMDVFGKNKVTNNLQFLLGAGWIF